MSGLALAVLFCAVCVVLTLAVQRRRSQRERAAYEREQCHLAAMRQARKDVVRLIARNHGRTS